MTVEARDRITVPPLLEDLTGQRSARRWRFKALEEISSIDNINKIVEIRLDPPGFITHAALLESIGKWLKGFEVYGKRPTVVLTIPDSDLLRDAHTSLASVGLSAYARHSRELLGIMAMGFPSDRRIKGEPDGVIGSLGVTDWEALQLLRQRGTVVSRDLQARDTIAMPGINNRLARLWHAGLVDRSFRPGKTPDIFGYPFRTT